MIMNKQEFLTSAGLQVQTLEIWLDQRWLVPDQTSAEITFSETDVARAHLIRDLKSDFGVNDEGVDVISISSISSTACAEHLSNCTGILRSFPASASIRPSNDGTE